VARVNAPRNRGPALARGDRSVTRSIAAALGVILAIMLLTALVSPAVAAGTEAQPRSAVTGASAGDGTHRLGFKAAGPDAAASFGGAGLPRAGAGLQLKKSVDLTAQLPPVGNQGGQGSCVAWAVSYYYKSAIEKREHARWNLSSPLYQFSPSFVYNQVNGGEDGGSSFPDAFDVLQKKGDVDIAEMPYDDRDYTRQPTAAQLEAAAPYRIPGGWNYLWLNGGLGPFSSANAIGDAKAWLSDGKPLVMGIPVYSDFPDFGSTPSSAYYDYNGSAGFAGGHGVCIAGYDDNINPRGSDADHRGGFKMVNSWGSSWNGSSRGFVWLSYDFVKRYVWEAWTMGDLAGDGPSTSGLSAGSGGVGGAIYINGNNFGTKRRSARVTFNGAEATQAVFTNSRVKATVPYGATSGPVVVYDWEGTASRVAAGASIVNTFTVNRPGHYSYYFAEGSTRDGFEEWLSLQNPGPSPVDVTATYMLIGGRGHVTRKYSIGPTSRLSVSVNQEVGPGQDVSVRLDAGGEFYAERPIYFSYKKGQDGYSWTGGHVAAGVAAPARDWYFAEGTTRAGFEEWICIQNPNSAEVVATVEYSTPQAAASRKDYRLGPLSRISVYVNGDIGPGLDVSVKVHCDSAIVAERPMYFDYKGKWDGGHVVMGTTTPQTTWYFAEGSTRPGFEEWLAVQNVNDRDTTITCRFLKKDGSGEDMSYTVGANSRWTLDVGKVLGAGVDSSVVLESELPVVAERPMYFCYKEGTQGYSWTGGHNVMGSPLAKSAWFFAEGCTYDWADEYICVANPGADRARVELTFTLEKGGRVEHSLDIEPRSRATVKVADVVGRGHDVSTRIISDAPVVAERPMYFDYKGWTGGHTGTGF
jgi:hypothetical protein